LIEAIINSEQGRTMPKEHIPATSSNMPGPIRDEEDLAEELEEDQVVSEDLAEKAPIDEEGGLGRRG
jgi:hypothetical protein